jgi:two-component system LytT family response regulator
MLEDIYIPIKVIGEASSIPEAVKMINKYQPQIVFLDIEMPGYSGLSILDFFDVDSIQFSIIFVTAYSEYAINAFELSAVDYILKPVVGEEVERSIKRVMRTDKQNLGVLKQNIDPGMDRKIAIRSTQGTDIVKLKDIMYIKAASSYSEIFLVSGSKIFASKKLKEFEKLENTEMFLKIHRSHIININFLKKISKVEKGTVIMTDDTELSISASKMTELLNLIGDL